MSDSAGCPSEARALLLWLPYRRDPGRRSAWLVFGKHLAARKWGWSEFFLLFETLGSGADERAGAPLAAVDDGQDQGPAGEEDEEG
jgi:hypothetical protein